MKKQKIQSFAKRLTWGIALTQLVVMAIASYVIYELAKDIVKQEEFDLFRKDLALNHANICNVLSEVSLAAANHRAEIEENIDRPDRLADIVGRIVAVNPHVRSCGISFVADYFPQRGRWFCPMAVKGDSGQVVSHFVGDANHDYLTEEWFTQALQADSAYWSKPFFDPVDSIALVARLMPVRDRQGRTVAVVGADLSLDSFMSHQRRWANDEDVDVDAYNFIIDSDGTYIAHPDSSLVAKGNYFERAKATADTLDDAVGRRMVAGQKGSYCDDDGEPTHIPYFDFGRFSAYIFYQPVEATGWSVASVVSRLIIDGLAAVTGIIMLFLIALALIVTRFVGRRIIKRATQPLTQLAASAGEVAKGNFSAPLPYIKHNDEIRQLRDAFENMQHSLTTYVDELKQTTASKAAIENELRVAHEIQMSMLPKTFPPYPDRDDIDIYGTLSPAKDVGGDLFDFFISGERLFFCVGDVSGKGVPASLLMAVNKSLFRNISAHAAEPHLIARALNQAVADSNETSMFVTLFVGVLNLATGRLDYCNAGHNAPLLIGREVSTISCEPNVPIGVMPDWTFVQQTTELAPGTTIFLFTDGLNEAEDADHRQFGDERVAAVAAALAAEGCNQPQTVVSRMAEAVGSFVASAEQSDDLTMLAIKYIKHNGN